MARISTSPAAIAVTNPVADTVASDVFEDCQFAWLVTVCVVLFDMTAVAVNCEESPGFAEEMDAVTVTELTVGVAVVGAVGVEAPLLPPQLTSVSATAIDVSRLRRL